MPATTGLAAPQWKQEAEAHANLFTSVGFVFLCLYLFSYFSLATELGIVLLGIKPYITIVAGPLAIICALGSGNWTRVWQHPAGKWYCLFVLWLIVGSPFAFYKTGALEVLYEFIPKQFAIIFMIVALAPTFTGIMRISRLMVGCAFLLYLVSLKLGGSVLGRFVIADTTLGNPNDLATHALFLIPFCLMTAMNSKRSLSITGLFAIGSAMLMLYLMMLTGSRGGMLSVLAALAALFWRSSSNQKVLLFGGAMLTVILSLALSPQGMIDRYKTFFSTGQQTTAELGAASGSADERWILFVRSLEVTARYPIFGVGIGNFEVEEVQHAKELGVRAAWLQTHNSYTQASSEGGIPAFLFFTGTLVACFRTNLRIQKRAANIPELKPAANMAFCLFVLCAGFAVNIFFSPMAYRFYQPTLAGITIVLSQHVNRELSNRGLRPLQDRR